MNFSRDFTLSILFTKHTERLRFWDSIGPFFVLWVKCFVSGRLRLLPKRCMSKWRKTETSEALFRCGISNTADFINLSDSDMCYFCIHILFFIALFSDSHNTDGAHQITHRILFTLCKICHRVMSQSFPMGSVLIDWQLEKTRTTRSDSNTFICTLGNLSKMIILYYTIILLWKFSSWTVCAWEVICLNWSTHCHL